MHNLAKAGKLYNQTVHAEVWANLTRLAPDMEPKNILFVLDKLSITSRDKSFKEFQPYLETFFESESAVNLNNLH